MSALEAHTGPCWEEEGARGKLESGLNRMAEGTMGPAPTVSSAKGINTPPPELQQLKVLLSWQETQGQEVAFRGTLIRGAKTTTSPNWFSDSKL